MTTADLTVPKSAVGQALSRRRVVPSRDVMGGGFGTTWAFTMTDDHPQQLGLLSKLVIAIAIVLIAAGAVWHGITWEGLQRGWHDLVDRPSGPMSFRFILQPLMAATAAIHDGIKDARTGRSPYFWTVALNPEERVARLREGLNATARIILLGLAMDVIYQLVVLKMFYPVEALLIAVLLAFGPYLLLRGPTARIARRWRGSIARSTPQEAAECSAGREHAGALEKSSLRLR